MSEILTQQEIDNLLSGISTGQGQAIPSALDTNKFDNVFTFDFRLPHRLSKNQLRTLQAVHESFGETFASYLLGRLQTTVSVNVISVDQLFYSEFVLSIANPSSIYVFRIAESDALALIELSPQLVLAIIERMLGGSSGGEKKPRFITRIEQSIFKTIITRALSDLQKSWMNVAPLTFVMERYETEGDFAQIAPASEIVLVISMELTISDEKYLMNVCFPTFALEAVLAKLNVQQFSGLSTSEKDTDWMNTLRKKLEQTEVSLTAILGNSTLTLEELLELEAGDVIRTPISLKGEVEVIIGDKTRLWGVPGISNGKNSIKVTRVANQQPKEEK